MRKIQRISKNPGKTIFLTLTYPARYPDGPGAKDNLRAFLERIRRHYPNAAAIWRIEYQKRGAPHFHLIFFNLPFLPFATLRQWWAEVISAYVDDQLPFVRIEMIRSRRGVIHYVSKYISKLQDVQEADCPGLFNPVPYLHAGRWWGFHNADAIPWAGRVFLVLNGRSFLQLRGAKAILKTGWDGIDIFSSQGGVAYTGDAYEIFNGMMRCLIT